MKAFVVDKYKKQGALRLADVPAPELEALPVPAIFAAGMGD